MNGRRNSWKTSIETRKPANRNTTPSSSPTKNALVAPNRFNPLVMAGMRPPIAIRIVAGTRLLIEPSSSARTAPGSEATRLTTIATGAIRRFETKDPMS